MEEWRDVVGYEGFYMVSSEGRVKSLDRRVSQSWTGYTTVKERILIPRINANGYYCVGINRNKKRKIEEYHKLVALAFLGARPEGRQIDHINRIKLDNRAVNLRYVSMSANLRNSVKCDKSASRFTGVYKAKQRHNWFASVRHNNKSIYLGAYTEESDAARAYNRYVIENKLDRELNHA